MAWRYQNKQHLLQYFILVRFLFIADVTTSVDLLRRLRYLLDVRAIENKVPKSLTKSLKSACEEIWIMLWPTVVSQISRTFSKTLLALPKLLFCRGKLWRLLLLLDKNSRYYERCIKQTRPRKFSILIKDSDLADKVTKGLTKSFKHNCEKNYF